ncbi:hypothetical protein [Streptomyces sp. GC420]|uniref:hypothetical protein n=1 Tax=Streptomyces sp. GC420 TaxID=2697568 RepID=UPI001414E73F|nr:hypothetical protein [Streptomyces sp. GC420]NBM17972.1 hypothetical protein [Streptomyces sp. GC420]
MAAVNGIYLPGWEYNRALAQDPCEPRNSALPGALLWNGAAPLWMFEKVYCTKESLDNELLAAQEVGWATSRIFGQLASGVGDSGPILEPVDWLCLGSGTQALVRQAHAALRREMPSRQVRNWIDQGDDPSLEKVNYSLLQPVAAARHSIVAGSMSGLRHWLSPPENQPGPMRTDPQEHIRELLSLISDPLAGRQHNGVRLLRHPRDWDPGALALQDDVKQRVETPFIRDLQAGEGDFAGARGFEPYIAGVAQEKAAYAEVDSVLLADWSNSLTRLLRLRDAAARHLWPSLHSDWLPALLREDADALADFPRFVKGALVSRHFAGLLNLSTRQIFGVVSAALAVAAVKDPSVAQTAAYASAGAGAVALFSERRLAPRAGPLAVFYQEAFSTLR